MPGFEVWDLVKVPFPYLNRPVRQHRPALIVNILHPKGAPALLWVFMVTSASHRRWEGDVLISDLVEAGLPAPSMVRSAKIATIERTEAERLGRLPEPDRRALAAILKEHASLFA